MRLKDLINITGIVLAVLLSLSGCQSDLGFHNEGNREVQLVLCPSDMDVHNVNTKSISQEVNEGTASDYVVNDFWLFEYDDQNNLLGSPRYYLSSEFQSGQKVSLLMPDADKEFKIVVVANTHNPDILSSIKFNTLDNLQYSFLEVHSVADLYQISGNSYDLLMNGVVPIYSNTVSVECELFRNVAKFELKLINREAAGIDILSVQLKNVPDHMFLIDQIYSEEESFPSLSMSGFVNFEKEDINLESGKESSWIKYYLPRNMRGKNLSTTERDKNINAPENATYLEVMGVREQVRIIYKFYLGSDNINDFNVIPNNLYRMVIDFADAPDPNDSRVDDGSVVLLEESNSYLINPKQGQVKYTVPIENRINTYWNSESGRRNANWRNYLVNTEKEWVAEIIWQDVRKTQLKFIDEEGNQTDVYNGFRDGRYFSFVLADDAEAGNVIIGVRRAGDAGNPWTEAEGYMWSWHIWITDYNPYEEVGPWQDGKYIYELSESNGSLHRYAALDRIEMYRNRYIMDRNLGAKGYAKSDGWKKCRGVMYEYGRKDPFPGYDAKDSDGKVAEDAIYTIDKDGNVTATSVSFQSFDGVNIYNSVISPLKYYYNPASEGDWTIDNQYRIYSWNDLTKAVQKGKGKSFFDPCPPGWQLPDYKIWGDFDRADKSDWNVNAGDQGWMIDLSASSEDDELAYFPASGMRVRTTGAPGSGGAVCAFWSATEEAGLCTRYCYFANSVMYKEQSPGYRAMALPVRCISSQESK